jgi:hypothetical protein
MLQATTAKNSLNIVPLKEIFIMMTLYIPLIIAESKPSGFRMKGIWTLEHYQWRLSLPRVWWSEVRTIEVSEEDYHNGLVNVLRVRELLHVD